jgi:lipoprotein-releasing system ATP-binding protein
MSDAILKTVDLKKSFDHGSIKVDVLKGVTFSLKSNEQAAIIGSSGEGKSTFLHIVGTLDGATSGQVFIKDKDVTNVSEKEISSIRNEYIGFIFQFHHLLPELTAVENVFLPGMIKGVSSKEIRKRAEFLLTEVGLSHRFEHKPGELSGGEQQRVAIARALIMKPKILLCDEITGNLDHNTGRKVFELLKKIAIEHSTSMLFVTHDAELAGELPRKYLLAEGVLKEC